LTKVGGPILLKHFGSNLCNKIGEQIQRLIFEPELLNFATRRPRRKMGGLVRPAQSGSILGGVALARENSGVIASMPRVVPVSRRTVKNHRILC